MTTRSFLFAVSLAAALTWPLATQAQIHVQIGGGYNHYQRDQHRNYDHARADTRAAYNHYGQDLHRNYDHAVSDVATYGTTNPYSSQLHYYNDQRQQYNHYRADQHQNYDHYVRDLTGSSYHYQPSTHRRSHH